MRTNSSIVSGTTSRLADLQHEPGMWKIQRQNGIPRMVSLWSQFYPVNKMHRNTAHFDQNSLKGWSIGPVTTPKVPHTSQKFGAEFPFYNAFWPSPVAMASLDPHVRAQPTLPGASTWHWEAIITLHDILLSNRMRLCNSFLHCKSSFWFISSSDIATCTGGVAKAYHVASETCTVIVNALCNARFVPDLHYQRARRASESICSRWDFRRQHDPGAFLEDNWKEIENCLWGRVSEDVLSGFQSGFRGVRWLLPKSGLRGGHEKGLKWHEKRL